MHVIGWPEPYTCSVINNVYVQYHVSTPLVLLCMSLVGQNHTHAVSLTMCTYSIMLAHPLCCCACHRLARAIHMQCHQQCVRTVSCWHTPFAAVLVMHAQGGPDLFSHTYGPMGYFLCSRSKQAPVPLMLLCMSCISGLARTSDGSYNVFVYYAVS